MRVLRAITILIVLSIVPYAALAQTSRSWDQPHGEIDLRTTPPGAAVFLQGEARGTTPMRLSDLRPGSYTLRVELNGYRPREEEVVVGSAATTLLRWTLDRATGTLQWRSSVADAEAVIGRERYTAAPIELPVGVYRVRFRAFGYVEVERTIQIRDDQDHLEEISFHPLPLQVTVGRVTRPRFWPENPGSAGRTTLLVDSSGPASAVLRIYDAADRLIRQEQIDLQSWVTRYNWDGRDQDGEALPEGTYRIELAIGTTGPAPPTIVARAPDRASTEITRAARVRPRLGGMDPATAVMMERQPPQLTGIQFEGAVDPRSGSVAGGGSFRIGIGSRTDVGAAVGALSSAQASILRAGGAIRYTSTVWQGAQAEVLAALVGFGALAAAPAATLNESPVGSMPSQLGVAIPVRVGGLHWGAVVALGFSANWTAGNPTAFFAPLVLSGVSIDGRRTSAAMSALWHQATAPEQRVRLRLEVHRFVGRGATAIGVFGSTTGSPPAGLPFDGLPTVGAAVTLFF